PTVMAVSEPSGAAVTLRAGGEGVATLRARVAGTGGAGDVVAELPVVTLLPSATLSFPDATPPRTALVVDDTLAVVPAVRDHRGLAHTPPAGRLRWTSSTPDVAAVDSITGSVRAIAPGNATITAVLPTRPVTVGAPTTARAAYEVVVRVLPVAASVRALPSLLPLAVLGTARVGGAARDSVGVPITDARRRWTTSDPTVAQVDSTGMVRGVAAGTATVTVTVNGRAATSRVVVGASPASGFALTMRFLGSPPERLADVVRTAAGRWSRVITGDLPDQPIDLPAGACEDAAPALRETVDDVLLLVSIDSIDGRGRILGAAGPCVLRDGDARSPAVGVVVLDSADLSALVANGQAATVVSHEIGHVLGIGTLWYGTAPSVLTADLRGPDPRFTGAATMSASAALGYTDDGEGVLLENVGGGGTRDSHWRESRYGRELMTGFINPGANPLSLVSVRALRDLGYTVSDFGADATSVLETTPELGLSFGLLRNVLASPLRGEAFDRVRGPVGTVGRDGRLRADVPTR
ncbi:MAG TPA: Ig-like domain-containing protein, partial [Gemmatirosa sp.]|nr:Ig-like domain-containing protein [Gemmatirosa sp.]